MDIWVRTPPSPVCWTSVRGNSFGISLTLTQNTLKMKHRKIRHIILSRFALTTVVLSLVFFLNLANLLAGTMAGSIQSFRSAKLDTPPRYIGENYSQNIQPKHRVPLILLVATIRRSVPTVTVPYSPFERNDQLTHCPLSLYGTSARIL